MPASPTKLTSCHCCGLVQQLPPLQDGEQPLCCRCNSTLRHGGANHWAAALAASALAFYLPAMLLPMMRIEKLGHRHEDSLLSGLFALFGQGYIFIGVIVLLFSVLLPPFKLIILLMLSASAKLRSSHRAILYHAVEFLGRWGMLDVMLMAILVAFVKLGDLVNINAGAGLWAFALMVLLSLFASLAFNPHLMWADDSIKPLSPLRQAQGTERGWSEGEGHGSEPVYPPHPSPLPQGEGTKNINPLPQGEGTKNINPLLQGEETKNINHPPQGRGGEVLSPQSSPRGRGR